MLSEVDTGKFRLFPPPSSSLKPCYAIAPPPTPPCRDGRIKVEIILVSVNAARGSGLWSFVRMHIRLDNGIMSRYPHAQSLT